MAGARKIGPGFRLTRTMVPHLEEQREGETSVKILHLSKLYLEKGPLLNTQVIRFYLLKVSQNLSN